MVWQRQHVWPETIFGHVLLISSFRILETIEYLSCIRFSDCQPLYISTINFILIGWIIWSLFKVYECVDMKEVFLCGNSSEARFLSRFPTPPFLALSPTETKIDDHGKYDVCNAHCAFSIYLPYAGPWNTREISFFCSVHIGCGVHFITWITRKTHITDVNKIIASISTMHEPEYKNRFCSPHVQHSLARMP